MDTKKIHTKTVRLLNALLSIFNKKTREKIINWMTIKLAKSGIIDSVILEHVNSADMWQVMQKGASNAVQAADIKYIPCV